MNIHRHLQLHSNKKNSLSFSEWADSQMNNMPLCRHANADMDTYNNWLILKQPFYSSTFDEQIASWNAQN